MADSRVTSPSAIIDSIEIWESVFAVPSTSPGPRYQSAEQEASSPPRITLGSPWAPAASYSLPQRARESTYELQYSAESRGSTAVPPTPSRDNVSRQADAHAPGRQASTDWQSPCQSRASSPDSDHSESAHGIARHVSRSTAESESGDFPRGDEMALERESSQASINATARRAGQRTAWSPRYRGSRAASRRSGHLSPRPRVEKPDRVAYYSRFLLSRIQQVANEVDRNRERYRTSGDGEDEIAVLTSIDKQLNDLLYRRVMRRGESVIPSSYCSDTGSMRDECHDRSEGSNNDY